MRGAPVAMPATLESLMTSAKPKGSGSDDIGILSYLRDWDTGIIQRRTCYFLNKNSLSYRIPVTPNKTYLTDALIIVAIITRGD